MIDRYGAPFFIVGAQRSGTTMLRLMLNQHSELCVPFETVFIPEFYDRIPDYQGPGGETRIEELLDDIIADPWVRKGDLIPDREAVLDKRPSDYAELVDAIFRTFAERQDKEIWGDKTPTYVEHIDVLDRLFPDCRVIHLVRDGRDVALSLSGISWGSRNLVRNAAEWRWKVVMGRKMGNMLRDRYLEIPYEKLVAAPGETLASVCGFLGVPFEEEMLAYPDAAAAAMPEKSLKWHRSSVSAPNPDKVDVWRTKMDASDRIVFDQVAGDALESFGYERVQSKPTWASRIRYARYALRGR